MGTLFGCTTCFSRAPNLADYTMNDLIIALSVFSDSERRWINIPDINKKEAIQQVMDKKEAHKASNSFFSPFDVLTNKLDKLVHILVCSKLYWLHVSKHYFRRRKQKLRNTAQRRFQVSSIATQTRRQLTVFSSLPMIHGEIQIRIFPGGMGVSAADKAK